VFSKSTNKDEEKKRRREDRRKEGEIKSKRSSRYLQNSHPRQQQKTKEDWKDGPRGANEGTMNSKNNKRTSKNAGGALTQTHN
jgi:hypothetical protein